MKQRLAKLSQRDDAQGWARHLAARAREAIGNAEETLRDVVVCDVHTAHTVEQLEMCVADALECEDAANRIILSGEPSLAAWFAAA